MNSNKMLQDFWFEFINLNKGKGSIVYFHNWAGYDAFLSLASLLRVYVHGPPAVHPGLRSKGFGPSNPWETPTGL